MAEEKTPPPRARTRNAVLAIAMLAVVAIGGALLVARDDWERTGPPLEVGAWAPYWQTNEAYNSFDAHADLFGDVSIVAFHATGAGDISTYEGLAIDATARFAERARPAGVPFLATIFDDTEAGVMAGVLADPTTRTAHARAIAKLVIDNGFDGVDLDYENFAFNDDRDTWDATRPNWIEFLDELTTILHADDKLVVVSVPNPDYTVYDHEAMGALVDRIRVMTYDYSTSKPGPIAPVHWVRDVIAELKDLVPPEKIDLGVPAYGMDWVVSTTGTCPADAELGRRAVTPSGAEARAAENGATILWDEESEEARFDYTATLTGVDAAGAPATCTVERTVRFLNAQAIHRRAWIAHREDLHGIAIWALGNDDPSLWPGIRTARDGEKQWTGTTLAPFVTEEPPETTGTS